MIVVSLTIWLSWWVASSHFSFQNIHMNVSATLFNIFVLIYICFIFSYYSYYCSFLSKVVSYSQIGIIRYRTLYWIDNLLICIITHVIVRSFIVAVAVHHFSSLLFQTLLLNTISISIINQRFWCSFTMLLLFALLFVRLIIKNSLHNRHRSTPPIILAWVKDMSKWLIDWEYMRTYNILVAEYQFAGCENSVWIATYCKDKVSFIHPHISWLILWFT